MKWINYCMLWLLIFCPQCITISNNVEVLSPQRAALLEDAILFEVNYYRSQYGQDILQKDSRLQDVARSYSKYMGEKNFFDHIDPKNRNLRDRLWSSGIVFSAAAENLAYVADCSLKPKEVLESWVSSKAHRQNLLDASFRQTGIGIFQNTQGEYYVTQIFLVRK